MKSFFLFFLFLSNYCFGQENKITIQGNISGLGSDTVYLWRYLMDDVDRTIRDTILARDGKFNYKLLLDKPTAMAVIPGKSFITRVSGRKYMPQGRFIELFVVPNDSITITGKLEPYYLEYIVDGSPINEKFSRLRKEYKTPEIEEAKIELLIDSLSAFPDTKEKRIELFGNRVSKRKEAAKIKMNFLKSNPDNEIAAYYLSEVSLDTIAWYYPKLTGNVRNGFFKNLLDKKYDTYLKYSAAKKAESELTPGKPAPDFVLSDLNGQQNKLSDFKGKMIVLDFWGTWCGPCMAEIPKLKSLQDSLKGKVTFISIACHDTKEAVEKNTKEHGIDWFQLLNTEENDVSVLYGIQAYPTKIIIDENMQIVERFIGVKEDFYKVMAKLTEQ